MKKNVLIVLVALNVVAVLVYCLYSGFNGQYRRHEQESRAAANVEFAGVMKADDYLRLRDISHSSRGEGGLSDEDVDWLLNLAASPPLNPNDPLTASLLFSDVTSIFEDCKRYTPSQESKIYDACVPYLTVKVGRNPDADKLEKLCSIGVMASLKDQRAVPHLLPLLNSPDPDIRRKVKEDLTVLGYTTT